MRRLFLILALAFPVFLTARPAGCPTGLMTDLVEHTESVWSNGFLTDLQLSDLPKSLGSFQTVEIRFRPGEMDSAFILYEGDRFPLRPTDRNENCRTRRQNGPAIDYSKLGGSHV